MEDINSIKTSFNVRASGGRLRRTIKFSPVVHWNMNNILGESYIIHNIVHPVLGTYPHDDSNWYYANVTCWEKPALKQLATCINIVQFHSEFALVLEFL